MKVQLKEYHDHEYKLYKIEFFFDHKDKSGHCAVEIYKNDPAGDIADKLVCMANYIRSPE